MGNVPPEVHDARRHRVRTHLNVKKGLLSNRRVQSNMQSSSFKESNVLGQIKELSTNACDYSVDNDNLENGFVVIGRTRREKLEAEVTELFDEADCELEVEDMEAVLQEGAVEIDGNVAATDNDKINTSLKTMVAESSNFDELDDLSSLDEKDVANDCIFAISLDETFLEEAIPVS
jgi:hypothetical protein